MSVPAVPTAEVCPLCETAVTEAQSRCPECGLDLAGVGARPVFTQALFWWTAMGFLAVYLITLAVVATTR